MRTGLALSGGGVKGSYEVGAYMAMKKCHLSIDTIIGDFIGAFNAAMMIAQKEEELSNIWQNTSFLSLISLDENFSKSLEGKELDYTFLKVTANQIFRTLQKHGLETEVLQNTLKNSNLGNAILKSSINLGIPVIRSSDKEPPYLFTKDIPKDKIIDYIMASSFSQIFNKDNRIDSSIYIDNNKYDNNPCNILLKEGYDLVYRIDLNTQGIKQKLIDEKRVITISPSRKINTSVIDQKQVNNNYLLGYYDTIKIIKKYPGYHYIFKDKSNDYYKFITRKVPTELMNKMMSSFSAKNEEDLIIRVLEHLMKHDNLTYFNIYNPWTLIKRYKDNDNILTKEFMSYLKFL